jgi:hypothetical protein
LKPSNKTILFLHGNAGNIGSHLGSVYWLPQQGFNVFIFDYRGYGLSEGSPTLEGVHEDVVRAVFYLEENKLGEEDILILYGQSLGATMALASAADKRLKERFEMVIAESPFASYKDIAEEKAGLTWVAMPFKWFVRWGTSDAYAPKALYRSLENTKILLVAGEKDAIVPAHHTKELAKLLPKSATLWLYQEADHLGVFTNQKARERLVTFTTRALE